MLLLLLLSVCVVTAVAVSVATCGDGLVGGRALFGGGSCGVLAQCAGPGEGGLLLPDAKKTRLLCLARRAYACA
ncbi:hypothetical protein BDK51DRAFT_44420 [Blyttiomyces helicus]|uniref:Secreted protein n=1 Tax=Blyttiomyces helicus TaxID=388810 RepID=A0A4P9W0P3_9FUNG|nr:hypothetical protein BDK51DRAFT_44420 [Blyttiomyces helicus]|eukprot:RKO85709.1 hypothetical protein BDK51DRAFT_44420 [Blyttiomyces helicus]